MSIQRVTVYVDYGSSFFDPPLPEERDIDLSTVPEAALELTNCACGVEPEQPHIDGCSHAHCPDCGYQLLLHDCHYWDDDADGPNRQSIWHGVDPAIEAAVKGRLYYFHSSPDVMRYFPDTGHAAAIFDWDLQAQKYLV